MPATIYRSRGWVVLGLKPAGLLLLMTFLVVELGLLLHGGASEHCTAA